MAIKRSKAAAFKVAQSPTRPQRKMAAKRKRNVPLRTRQLKRKTTTPSRKQTKEGITQNTEPKLESTCVTVLDNDNNIITSMKAMIPTLRVQVHVLQWCIWTMMILFFIP